MKAEARVKSGFFFVLKCIYKIMTHLRTKRKNKTKNVLGLVFSIFLIFASMALLFGVSDFLKEKSSSFNVFARNNSNDSVINRENSSDSLNTFSFHEEEDGALITKNGDKIFVEVANTPVLREQGLSGRSPLKIYEENDKVYTEGLLFVFEKLETSNFWMKEMNFDLDIIWLDESFTVVHIENALASSYYSVDPYSSQVFTNGDNLAKYVLEVKMGIVKRLDLEVGDSFDVDRVQL